MFTGILEFCQVMLVNSIEGCSGFWVGSLRRPYFKEGVVHILRVSRVVSLAHCLLDALQGQCVRNGDYMSTVLVNPPGPKSTAIRR